jgi:hypothetical protein
MGNIISVDKRIAPCLYQRTFPNGTVTYRIKLRPKRQSFSLTFETEEDAKKWLQTNYYACMQFPEHYHLLKKKKWI